ncbi:MAG: hypothetical protein QM536_03565 [Chitinophagaceae bacterium]|nr:hypothetical protein [Chitinophagaceae bacterium]
MKKIITILFICIQHQIYAQETQQITPHTSENTSIPMADAFRKEGKIYIVITIILIILIGIFLYILTIDKKIKYIEQKLTEIKINTPS